MTSDAGKRDAIWTSVQKALETAFRRNDLHKVSYLYYKMALFLDEEDKSPTMFLKLSNKIKLMDYKQKGIIDRIKIISACGCSACEKMNGQVYLIDDAIKKQLLPVAGCTYNMNSQKHGFCRCTYVPHVT